MSGWGSGWGARRAERFADALDHPTSLADHVSLDPGLEPLVETVGALRVVAQRAPAARPEFVADLRERLLAEAATALAPTEERLLLDRRPARHPASRRPTRLAAAGVALVLAGGTAGVAVAADNSLPGQPLYTLKQGIEAADRTLQLSGAGEGRAQLRQASTRLDEAERLLQRGDTGPLRSTLTAFTSSAGAGSDHLFTAYQADSDHADVTAVRTFTASAMKQLAAISARAPAADRTQLHSAASLLSQLDQEAQLLCPQCGSAAPLQVPSALGAGLAAPQSLPDAAQAAVEQALVVDLPQVPSATAVGGATANAEPSATPTSASSSGLPVSKVPSSATSALPTPVSSALASTTNQVTTAVNGVVQAAVGAVGNTVTGTVNGVTGILGATATPKP